MIKLLELKFSRRWQTNKIESDWSNSIRAGTLTERRYRALQYVYKAKLIKAEEKFSRKQDK